VVEAAIPGSEQSPEATRLAQKSAQEFAAGNVSKAQELAGDSALAVAYTHLQRIVGVMAILLPFVLFSGNWALTGNELESSISAYYHTPVGRVFVGVLWALGVFFLSYNFRPLPGFNLDNKLSTLASIAAVCVAVFPTTSDASVATRAEKNIGIVHMVSAGLLFTLLAIFALFLFPRSSGAMTPEKRRRNIVYRTCGGIMAAAILSMFPSQLLPDSWHAFLWLETLCVLAFGTSWLIKGAFLGILADNTPAPAPALSAPG
jgi:VIT1/CCC1 family predicted Fe2+/Mn2+ transporter